MSVKSEGLLGDIKKANVLHHLLQVKFLYLHFILCIKSLPKSASYPNNMNYSKTCRKRPLKNRQNKGLKDKW